MLRSGRSNKQIWPGAPVEVGQQPRWPATSIPQSTKPTGTKNSTAADSDAEGAAPDYQNTFGNAMEAALAGLNCGENAGNAGGGKKGKFKKGKGRLLFSTWLKYWII